MDGAVLFFFEEKPGALPLYEALEKRILSEIDHVTVKVQKTQISFANKHNFAFASFLPARRAKARPDPYLTVTFGLERRVDSLRIDAAVEPYPSRWTHHVLIADPSEVDDELMGWIKEAAEFSAQKRPRKRG